MGQEEPRMIQEAQIRNEVASTLAASLPVQVEVSAYTPSGRPRNVLLFVAEIGNAYLGTTRELKGRSEDEVQVKAKDQLERWAEQELRKRLASATQDAKSQAFEATQTAAERIRALREILSATLSIDDRIDWDAWFDRRDPPKPPKFPAFSFSPAPPQPQRGFFQLLIPPLWKRTLAQWTTAMEAWERGRRTAELAHAQMLADGKLEYERRLSEFLSTQRERNAALQRFRERFEAGEGAFVEEYARVVFERSAYPDSFPREYTVAFEASEKHLSVDVALPSQDQIPSAVEVKFDPRSKTLREVAMKPKEHAELYDSAVKQCVLRTFHEIFEAVYVQHVERVTIRGNVTRLDPATGRDATACLISVSTTRAQFEAIKLAWVTPDACIKALQKTSVEYAGAPHP